MKSDSALGSGGRNAQQGRNPASLAGVGDSAHYGSLDGGRGAQTGSGDRFRDLGAVAAVRINVCVCRQGEHPLRKGRLAVQRRKVFVAWRVEQAEHQGPRFRRERSERRQVNP